MVMRGDHLGGCGVSPSVVGVGLGLVWGEKRLEDLLVYLSVS